MIGGLSSRATGVMKAFAVRTSIIGIFPRFPSGPRDHRGGNVPARPPVTTESHPIPSEPRDHRGGNVPARPPATTESSPIPSRDIGGLPLMFGSCPSEEMIAAMLARKREEP